MHLPLVALLVLTAPGLAPQSRFAKLLAGRTETIPAIDASAAHRFGWVEARRPSEGASVDPLHAVDHFARTWQSLGDPLGVVHAVRWVDSLPLRLAVQDGGVTLSLRFRV